MSQEPTGNLNAINTEPMCGIIMPISDCDNCPKVHWQQVKSIIEEAALAANCTPRLVSETFETNLIHREILQNIYTDPVVVCDVSGRNPNVFFELGIRMATQKPVVLIKDSETIYPFDTAPNRYIEYPRDLRYADIIRFKAQLTEQIARALEQDESSSFIGTLGPFKVPEVDSKTVPFQELLFDRLDQIDARLPSVLPPARRILDSFIGSTISIWADNQGRCMIVAKKYDSSQLSDAVGKVAKGKFSIVKVISYSDDNDKGTVHVEGLRLSSMQSFGNSLEAELSDEIPF